MKPLIVAYSCLWLLIISCEEKAPKELLEEDTYIQLMAEMQLSRAYLQVTKDTTAHVAIRKEILDKYQVNDKIFEQSHLWYEQNFEEQLERYIKMRSYIEYLEDGPLKQLSPVLAPLSDSLFNQNKNLSTEE